MGRSDNKVALAGERYGRLTVVGEDGIRLSPKGYRMRYVECRCDCGNDVSSVRVTQLQNGQTKSCGCFRREVTRRRGTTHGDTAPDNGRWAPEYTTWVGMIQRCENPNNARFKDWGGRGITICEQWRNSYERFLSDMGRKPSKKHSIDRKDNDGNYEPGNCRWATDAEQRANKGRRKLLDDKSAIS